MDEPPPPVPPPSSDSACAGCDELLKPESRFCSRCGLRRGDPAPAYRPPAGVEDVALRTRAGLQDIRFVIVFYLALLGAQGLSALLFFASGSQQTALTAGIALMGVFTLVAAARRPEVIRDLYRRAGFSWPGYLLVLLASVPIFLGVHAFVEGVGLLFKIKPPRFLDALEGRGLAWSFALGAAAPALVEELGFRGLVFGLLRRRLTVGEAFLISSAAFAILHLSIPSLATHVPLGLYLCWLRHRSDSLFPPMAAHALHNGWVILVEHFSWLA